ncbi:beta-1,4-glucuronyltransferase 1-like [Styela clava]
MGLCRNIRRSWWMFLVTVLLSVIMFLRRDLNYSLSKFEDLEMLSMFNDDSFLDFVSRSNVRTFLSQSGKYMIYSDIKKRKMEIEHSDVTIVTHCSFYNLRYLLDLATFWNGPISLAVFTTTPTKTLILIDLLSRCSPQINNYVNFHMVVPFTGLKYKKINSLEPDEPNILKILNHLKEEKQHSNLICDNMGSLLHSFDNLEKNYELKSSLDYPSNVLRNAAWELSTTKHILNIDIDIIPSKYLRSLLREFLHQIVPFSDKTAYVLPVFEIKYGVFLKMKTHFPISKNELVKLTQKNYVRQFYHDPCFLCQNCTNFNAWFETKSSNLDVVGYEFYFKPPCEPFLILPKNAPKFDERFLQYGYNRFSQICEVLTAGFDFKVLDNAFLIHLGFKSNSPDDFHFKKVEEHAKQSAKFPSFLQELRNKYPNSQHFC